MMMDGTRTIVPVRLLYYIGKPCACREADGS